MSDEQADVDGGPFARTVSNMRWMSLVIVYAGMLMVNQFFAQLALGRFGADGFESYLSNLEQNAHIDGVTRDVLGLLGDNSAVFAPALAVFVVVTGLACMLLLGRPVVAFVVSGFFWILWYITSGISGIWTFEYLFPAAFTLVAGLATLPQFVGSTGASRWLGGRVLGTLDIRIWTVIAVAVAAVLGWFFSMAKSGGPGESTQVSVISAIAIGALLIVTGFLDRRRHDGLVTPDGSIGRLAHVPWEAVMIVGIGAMMTIQVFADVEVGWFDTSGYEGLVSSYADNTGAPGWWSAFLDFVADNAEFFMPLQAAAEFACAFFLVTLLVRTLALLATFGFFFTLMFSEFGVSATIKAGSETTWEWEMLFLTGVIFMLAVAHIARALAQTTWRDRLLGDRFFLVIPVWGQVLVGLAGAFLVWTVGIQTRMFGSGYATISWRGGLYFLGCFVVLIIVDRMRTPTSLDDRRTRVWVR